MRHRTVLRPAACTVAVLALLTACASEPAPRPTRTRTVTVTPTPAQPQAGRDTAAAGAGTDAGTGGAGTPSPPAATFGEVQRPDLTVFTPQEAERVPDTNGLRAFTVEQLRAQGARARAGCEPGIRFDALDPASTASVYYTSVVPDECGGGMAAIWGLKDGRWVEVWTGNDAPSCSQLQASGAALNPEVTGPCQ